MEDKITLITSADFALAGPMLTLALAGIVLLMSDLFIPASNKFARPALTLVGLAVAAIVLFMGGAPGPEPIYAFHDCLRLDRMAFTAQAVIIAATAFLTLVTPVYMRDRVAPRGEYYALTLLSACGMCALAASNELITLFVNLEIASFALYIMVGLEKENLRSTEAAFKYFLVGSYSAAFLLFGMALVYGATGSTHLNEIGAALATGELGGVLTTSLPLAAGFALMIVGFGFKLTFAPFHLYAPDVYAGAPAPVAGLIGTISKVGGLAAFFAVARVFSAWTDLPFGFKVGLYGIAMLTIFVGNVGASFLGSGAGLPARFASVRAPTTALAPTPSAME